ncbi:MAG: YtrH family sporulation protein [Bacillaceae bacterium]|uniref:YtrH family sporulation protein n=1 Tax=Alkalihalobacterium chitinilyticum TaxID=2980103 RepID=A0ABT5VB15_9BACI|nr:YtrH family sporulation protein [Alkalihalobacterium chitinilyticum]MDE5412321.1 YtrH family sporulation protein [Alkalihalobacterium chitinilyticum]MEB1807776.1 YtrH family sporulation protein [Bacillaceae bacterium]
MDRNFAATLVVDFFVAFGVIIGGAIIGGISAFLIGEPPLQKISELAASLKIWAIVAAIGGTFDAFTSLERGLFQGTHDDIFKTLFMIFAALCGAQAGTTIIHWLTQSSAS